MKKDNHINYLIASSHDENWGLTVSTVGSQHIPIDTIYPPKNHPSGYLFSIQEGRVLDEYALLYIAHGSGYFSSPERKNVKLNAGSMVLLFPGEWHNYYPDRATGWDEYWIGFKGKHIDERVCNGFFSKQKEIYQVGSSLEIVQLFKSAIHVAKEQKVGYQQILAGIASLLLGLTNSLDKNSTADQANMNEQINKAKVIMFENFQTEISAKDIASSVCMSYSWFRRIFKENTGLSPYQYIQELRIKKGKELLLTTSLTSQEIAYKVGYSDPLHFGVIFKKKTGFAPVLYRKMHQNKIK